LDLQNENEPYKTDQILKIQTAKTHAQMVFYWNKPTNKVNPDVAALLKAHTTLHLLANAEKKRAAKTRKGSNFITELNLIIIIPPYSSTIQLFVSHYSN